MKLWKTFTDCFNCLPIAAIIDDKIFCCHGGMCVCACVCLIWDVVSLFLLYGDLR